MSEQTEVKPKHWRMKLFRAWIVFSGLWIVGYSLPNLDRLSIDRPVPFIEVSLASNPGQVRATFTEGSWACWKRIVGRVESEWTFSARLDMTSNEYNRISWYPNDRLKECYRKERRKYMIAEFWQEPAATIMWIVGVPIAALIIGIPGIPIALTLWRWINKVPANG